LTRSLAAVIAVAAAILVFGITISEHRLQLAFNASRQSDWRQREILDGSERVAKLVVDLESGERGFLLTGDRSFLEPYDSARAELPRWLDTLGRLTAEDAAEHDGVTRIARLIERWHEEAGTPELEARQSAPAVTPELAAMVAKGTGKRIIDAIRAELDRLLTLEALERERATSVVEENRVGARRTVAASGALAGLVALVLGLFASLQLRRGIRRMVVASEEIARGQFDAAIPDETAPLDRIAASLRATAAALAERDRQADSLLAVGRASSQTSLEALVADVHTAIAPVVDTVGLSLVAIEGDAARRLATYPHDLLQAGEMSRVAHSALGEVLRSRRPLTIDDVSDDKYPENALARRVGANAYVVMPLVIGDRIHSVMKLMLRHKRDLNPSSLRYLHTLGPQLSGVVYSAELTAELRTRNEELERATRAKSDFLAMMSHELRTPLNSIIGFSDVLVDATFGALNERQTRYVRNVNDSGRHLLRLINDLLDMSKIEAGRLEIMHEPCPARTVVVEALAALQPLADQKKLRLELIQGETPPPVLGDAVRLKQILYNLLSNAIKFTPEGGRVSVALEVIPDRRQLRISVTDSGPGIAADELPRLFQPFSQLHNAGHDPRAGTGLGLALTKQLVELMHGRVTVESAPGSGSRFSVDLPIASESPSAPPATTGEPGTPLALIVDDDTSARELLQLALESAHYRCVSAVSGEEALRCAGELAPDVILLDVFLPGIDGWDVLKALREDPSTRHIPVVLITISNDRQTSFSLGAVDHLVKPVSGETLLASLSRRSLTSAVKQRTVRILVVDDDVQHCELVRAALQPHGFHVRAVHDGRSGIEAALAEPFDLVLLDLVMPDLSGVDVVAALRAEERTRQLAIILVTANQLSASDRAQLNGSVSAILAKGSTGTGQLLLEVRRVLEKKR
jgi:signal transduction histidine kinase/DNA-binding response OmpR family regulator